MASPRYTLPESEPTEADVRQWQAELDRDRRAADRTPVAMIAGAYELPFVVSRDGSCHQLVPAPLDPEGHPEGGSRFMWQAMPPIPGSPAAFSYRPANGREAMYESAEARKPFLPSDEARWITCPTCQGHPKRMPDCTLCRGAGGAFEPAFYPFDGPVNGRQK